MSAQATRRGIPAVALWGGLGTLAWAALTVLTGGSSAHADDGDSSLLDGVGSLVSQTVSTVGDTLTAVTQPVVNEVVAPVVTEVAAPVVTEVVAPVVTHVAAPVQQAAPVVVDTVPETVAQIPVVGQPAAPVVETVVEAATDAVAETTESVTAPVAALLQDSPTSQVVGPVTDAAASLPILGALLDRLGVFTLVEDLAGVVDDATSTVGGVVDEVVEIIDPPDAVVLDPVTAAPADMPGILSADSAAAPSRATDLRSAGTSRALLTDSRTALQPVAVPAASTSSAPASDEEGTPVPVPVGSPVPLSGTSGSGGASALSHARLGDVDLPVLPAVERTPGAPDDVLPTSLVADTDVSPD